MESVPMRTADHINVRKSKRLAKSLGTEPRPYDPFATGACERCGKVKRLDLLLQPPDSSSWFCRPCYELLIQSWVTLAVRAGKLDRRYQSIYGLSLEEYGAMFVRQGGACAICQRDSDLPGAGLLVVDHDHQTGRVRGLLCSTCNAGIGMLGDSPLNLAAAIQYLLCETVQASTLTARRYRL